MEKRFWKMSEIKSEEEGVKGERKRKDGGIKQWKGEGERKGEDREGEKLRTGEGGGRSIKDR